MSLQPILTLIVFDLTMSETRICGDSSPVKAMTWMDKDHGIHRYIIHEIFITTYLGKIDPAKYSMNRVLV